jgi:NAD(P)-dependent dehydrogenase (short-subunit alcohol dehydrogenase family)
VKAPGAALVEQLLENMIISFEEKTAVVTGGTSGIGKAATLQLVSAGARVVVLSNAPPPREEEISRFAEKLFFIHCDVTQPQQIRSAFEEIQSRFGVLDVLVCNAGIQTYGSVVDTEESLWDQTMEVNLKSVYLCARHAIPLMEQAAHPVIVNVGSLQGFVSQRKVAAYATSKEALHGLTRSIAIDFAPRIRCVAVCPGAVWTPMLEKDLEECEDRQAALEETRNIHLLKRIASAEEVANFITFLASDKASFATGQTFRVDGGAGLRIEGT